jgi:hypothetical protein
MTAGDGEKDLTGQHTLTVMAGRVPAIFAPTVETRMVGTCSASMVRASRQPAALPA